MKLSNSQANPTPDVLDIDDFLFLEIGLPLEDFNQAMVNLNQKIYGLTGEILVRESRVHIKGLKIHSHYYRSGNTRTDRQRPRLGECWPWLV